MAAKRLKNWIGVTANPTVSRLSPGSVLKGADNFLKY